GGARLQPAVLPARSRRARSGPRGTVSRAEAADAGPEPHRLWLRPDSAVRPRLRAAETPGPPRRAIHPRDVRGGVRPVRAREVDRGAAAAQALALRLPERPHLRRPRLLRGRHLPLVGAREAPGLAMAGQGGATGFDPRCCDEPHLPAITLGERRARRSYRRSRVPSDLPAGGRPEAQAVAVTRAGGPEPPARPESAQR